MYSKQMGTIWFAGTNFINKLSFAHCLTRVEIEYPKRLRKRMAMAGDVIFSSELYYVLQN